MVTSLTREQIRGIAEDLLDQDELAEFVDLERFFEREASDLPDLDEPLMDTDSVHVEACAVTCYISMAAR